MDEFLAAALLDAANGFLAPAHHHAIHALELGLKAAIVADGGVAGRTHHPGGEFGRRFKQQVPPAELRRVNRILADYGVMRYPGFERPEDDAIKNDVAFIAGFVEHTLRALIDGRLEREP